MQKTEKELKELVKEKYSKIALQEVEVNKASCCGGTCESTEVYNIMTDDYSQLDGYTQDADLGLGCGLPTEYAAIKQGDTVLDLGSGAGNDAFVARHETGVEGKVIGVDFSDEMIKKARKNVQTLGFNNVEFRSGDIEDLPVGEDSIDVVISNCVLNLVPNKANVLSEIYRVLKPGGHFSISDIVLKGELPSGLREDAEMYVGCVSGAIQKDEYLDIIKNSGFNSIEVQKSKPIIIPNDILSRYLSADEIREFNKGDQGVYSITVKAIKPTVKSEEPSPAFTITEQDSCQPGSGCC